MEQFKADYDILTTADDGPRRLENLQIAVFHTTENDDNTDPRRVARWQLDRNNQSSYNVLVGTNGETVRGNDDNFIPWAAGPTGNRLGVHMSAIGYAARSRQEWLSWPKQIETMARWASHVSRQYGIPLKWLSAEEVRRGAKGFCGHGEVSAAWREVDHWDPGRGFPHDVILNRAKTLSSGTFPKKEGPKMSEQKLDEILKRQGLILDQLNGYPWEKYPGWEQLGGRTLVNAVAAIGEKLGVEGMKDLKE